MQPASLPAETDAPEFVFPFEIKTADIKSTIFHKKKMVELVDINKVCGFLKHNMGVSFGGIAKYAHLPYKTEVDQMTKYKELYNREKKGFMTSFHLPKHSWGRILPSAYASLSVYHRATRHSLCDGVYADIDMVNAQPTILMEICRHHSIAMHWLQDYVKDPKFYREGIMAHHQVSKDIAKQLPLTLMFGGSYDGWIKENNITHNDTFKIQNIINIETEMKQVIEIVYGNNKAIERAVLRHNPNQWTTPEERKRGVMALWAQTVERLLQETAVQFLIDVKGFDIEYIVPCQDGFMVPIDWYYEEILADIKAVIFSKFNIRLDWIRKPFDEAVPIPVLENNKTAEEWDDLLSCKKLADRFVAQWGDYLVLEDGQVFVYWVDKTTGIGRWYNETDDKKRYKMTLYISEDLYQLVESEMRDSASLNSKELTMLLKKARDRTSRGGDFSDIVRHSLSQMRQTSGIFNKKDYLLGFTNGVMDLRPGFGFRPYAFDDYMTVTTNYDYVAVPENDTTRALQEELVTILETIMPCPKQRLLYLQTLASGLDGRAYQKMFLFNGQGGNGKGWTGSMMQMLLGDYYYQAPNGILKDAEKSNVPSPDLYNCMYKRYINFKEVGGLISVQLLRNFTGGGHFTGRLLNQNPVQFKMNATFVMEFNNPPDLNGKPQASDYRRLVHQQFPVNFTDDANKIDKVIAGIQYRKANTYYETEEFALKMRPIFLDMLLGVYETYYEENKGIIFTIPDEVRTRTEQFIADQNLFQKVFYDNYKKTSSMEASHRMFVKDMWGNFQSSGDYQRLKAREKREYGRDAYYKWCEESFTVEGLKNGWFISGIVKRDGEFDTDEA